LHRSEIQRLLARVSGRRSESKDVKRERQAIGYFTVFIEDENTPLVLMSEWSHHTGLFLLEGEGVA